MTSGVTLVLRCGGSSLKDAGISQVLQGFADADGQFVQRSVVQDRKAGFGIHSEPGVTAVPGEVLLHHFVRYRTARVVDRLLSQPSTRMSVSAEFDPTSSCRIQHDKESEWALVTLML